MSPLYTPGKLTLRQTWQPMDPDAAAYITITYTQVSNTTIAAEVMP